MAFFRKLTKRTLVLINIAIAIAFLLGMYAVHFNPERWWFVGMLTLGSPFLFVALVCFIAFWFITKKKMMLIGIISMLLSWNPLGQLFKFKTATTFNINKPDSTIRVMSWNVEHFDILEHKLHPEVKLQMQNLIIDYNPDVACFQEMVGSDQYPEAINYIPDFAKALRFKDYYFSYSSKDDFDSHHHFGKIIYSKYPIINRRTIGFEPHTYENTFAYVDIVKDKDTFRVFNVHLQSLRLSKENRNYIEDAKENKSINIEESKSLIMRYKNAVIKRQMQADFLHKEVLQSKYPVIFCGDFNDVPNSYAYSTIGNGLQNAFAKKGSAIGRTFSAISPTLRIDNIFFDNNFTVEQYTSVKKKLSDHYPIFADVVYDANR